MALQSRAWQTCSLRVGVGPSRGVVKKSMRNSRDASSCTPGRIIAHLCVCPVALHVTSGIPVDVPSRNRHSRGGIPVDVPPRTLLRLAHLRHDLSLRAGGHVRSSIVPLQRPLLNRCVVPLVGRKTGRAQCYLPLLPLRLSSHCVDFNNALLRLP